MRQRFPLWPGPLATGLLLGLAALSGCDKDRQASPAVAQAGDTTARDKAAPESDVSADSLLNAVVHLLRTAATNPGGSNFDIAKDHLNEVFEYPAPDQFAMSDDARRYLMERMGETAPQAIADLEAPLFTVRDSRHIEDCLLLSTIASRVAGNGEDLVRVRRVFDWLMRQVQLVPAGALAPSSEIPQAQARPYDVLLRGMATEQGAWAERSWTFMALCRQLGVDVGLLRYTPRQGGSLAVPKATEDASDESVAWITAALIDGTPYLFDCRLGIPVPGPDGQGVATLQQAIDDPAILAALELPDAAEGLPGGPRSLRQADLASGTIQVWIDSTLGNLSTRSRELQERLAGRNRMVLYRDPAEVHEAFARALGPRFGGSDLWPLPMEVEFLLFNDPNFVRATQYSIALFEARWPLLPARMGQLNGNIDAAIQSYVAFRFADQPVENDGETPIPPQVQALLDLYATYYLALGKLDQGNPSQAELFFKQTLRMMPEPGPDRPYLAMFRWGAHSNLGRLNEERGDAVTAIRHYGAGQPTPEDHGNRLRARALIWQDPFVPEAPAEILRPQAPAPTTVAFRRS